MLEGETQNISGVDGVPLVQVRHGRRLKLLLYLTRPVLLTPGRALSIAVTLVTWVDAVREEQAIAVKWPSNDRQMRRGRRWRESRDEP